MTANIFSPSIAAAVPMKPRHGPHRADFERLAEHVMRVQLALGYPCHPATLSSLTPQALKVLQKAAPSDDALHKEYARALSM
jgi:hypothetical protein